MDASKDGFEEYLYRSPIESVEIEYRCEGRLLGVGIADVEPRALSAVYCFFDPEEERRSPGVLNVLTLVEECRRRRLPYLYLGYWVEGSQTMALQGRLPALRAAAPRRLLGAARAGLTPTGVGGG